MSQTRATVTTDWSLVADFTGKYVKFMSVSREEEVELQIGFGSTQPTVAEFILTESFLAIQTRRVPSGSKVWARTLASTADVVINYD
jgi:hypothetical protein